MSESKFLYYGEYLIKYNLDSPLKYKRMHNKAELKFGSGEKVLLVDESKFMRRALGDALEFLNYSVIETENVLEALAIIEKTDDTAIVVYNMNGPVIYGIDLLYKVRKQNIVMPFVLITEGFGAESLASRQALAGLVFISKPFTLVELSYALANRNNDISKTAV